MNYSNYEKAQMCGSLFYYDSEYNSDLAYEVFSVLEKHKFFPPKKVYADLLTKRKFVNYSPDMRSLLVKAYSEKNVFGIDMATGNNTSENDYWRLTWDFTFYKNEKLCVTPQFMPWNVLSLYSTHGLLEDEGIYRNYLSCLLELITVIDPFYMKIDDVSNSVDLLAKIKQTHFTPGCVQQIYWGNYFGPQYCSKYNVFASNVIPAYKSESVGNGIFFTLSDNLLDFSSDECITRRKEILKYLQIKQ